MYVDFKDLGCKIDLLDWKHQYIEELRMWGARKDVTQPLPNLKIAEHEIIKNLHESTELIIKKLMNDLPPEAKQSNLKKFKVLDHQAMSIELRGQKFDGKDILIVYTIISSGSKTVLLALTLFEKDFEKFKEEFIDIVNSVQFYGDSKQKEAKIGKNETKKKNKGKKIKQL
ncbi:MAG: hypothetical protein EAX96_06680 [Candidatus Lokiarchaeota archaeon]|nr:hypothetical protein [Candidatus Lokiarchaeota archaeon]